MTSPSIEHPDLAAIQRRTLRLLFLTQIAGGVGAVIGSSVGALLAAEMAGVGVSGLAQSAAVMGSALLAIPAARIVHRFGRGPSLSMLYLVAMAGASFAVTAAIIRSIPLLFLGYFLFGGASTASLQARFAAVDLAPPDRYGRHLSLIVWASTLGGVLGPNLAPVAGNALSPYGVPPLAAPYAFSAVLFIVAAGLLFLFLRPDPSLTARLMSGAPEATSKSRIGMRAGFQAVRAAPAARLGVVAMAVGHVVMVGVMAMTPVHIRAAGHSAGETLRVVGLVISVHVAGMYAFSPVMGWLSDRVGRTRVILGGVALLLLACLTAGTAGHDSLRLGIGLILLGLGWSATMVAGSTLLTKSVATELKPAVQGFSDVVMGLAGASGGALAGVVVHAYGYPVLTLLAACATLPLAFLVINLGPESPAPVPTA